MVVWLGGEVMLNKDDWAYTPDDYPSHWKLDISDKAHVIGAKAALSSVGFRGHKVKIPRKDLPSVIRKLNRACRKYGLKPLPVPGEKEIKHDGLFFDYMIS